ncbi:serine/threonine-protein kinase [Streptomyces sp. NRRL S-87]|uniref:serine/threonine-protein kinase n=1 Tax=Streptomyces sp. NRRL S-87 TaxID=1463920 RepID=UPI00068C0A41|nr:serine/threonine-protein kinase [Streptomyces sp. NRRL S-87]
MHRQGDTVDGRYRLEKPLGAGGMGEVWKATDLKLGRKIAIKLLIMPRDADDIDPAVKRLGKEARALALVGHEHAVTVHDCGGGAGVFYITMELLRGETLQTVLEKARSELAEGKPLDASLPALSDVVAWADQICDVLESAHANDIVHRDIKPSNVMVTQRGAVRVLDFGIAKLLEESGQTRPGTVLGTPAYMSPEQFRGAAGRQSDLYSLGCLMYALVTGWPPERGDGVGVPEPGRLRPGLPAALDHLIVRLLETDPAERPRGAGEVRRILEAVLVQPGAGPATPVPLQVPVQGPLPTSVPAPGPPVPAPVPVPVPAPVLPGDRGPAPVEPLYEAEFELVEPYDPEFEPPDEDGEPKESGWWEALYAPQPEPEPRPQPQRQPQPQPAHVARRPPRRDLPAPRPVTTPATAIERREPVRHEGLEAVTTVLLTWGSTFGLVRSTTELGFVLSALCGATAAGLAIGVLIVVDEFELYAHGFRGGYSARHTKGEDLAAGAAVTASFIVLGGCIWLMVSQADIPWWADLLAGAGEALGLIAIASAAFFSMLEDGSFRNPGQVLFNGTMLGGIAFGLFLAVLDMAWWTSMIAAVGVWAAMSFVSALLDAALAMRRA